MTTAATDAAPGANWERKARYKAWRCSVHTQLDRILDELVGEPAEMGGRTRAFELQHWDGAKLSAVLMLAYHEHEGAL